MYYLCFYLKVSSIQNNTSQNNVLQLFLKTYYYKLNIQYWMPFWNLKNAYFLYINKCGGASFVWGLTWYAHIFVINITVNRSWDNFNKCKYSKLYVSFISSKSKVESSKAFMIYVIVVLITKGMISFFVI